MEFFLSASSALTPGRSGPAEPSSTVPAHDPLTVQMTCTMRGASGWHNEWDHEPSDALSRLRAALRAAGVDGTLLGPGFDAAEAEWAQDGTVLTAAFTLRPSNSIGPLQRAQLEVALAAQGAALTDGR